MPRADLLEIGVEAQTAFLEFEPEQSRALLLPPLTPAARNLLWILAGLFLLGVSLRLNGSSIACGRLHHWKDVTLVDAPSGLLLSEPKMIRSDEWLVWTPAILSQARQVPAFPASNPSLGPGKTPLLMSIPARDYTMVLRPQLWGYFFLPIEFGFAWNWDFKVFGLLSASFVLFWTITAGKFGPSLFGAVCVFFSPLVQWWFSSPSMLPEMLTYWALGVTAALRLFGNCTPRAPGTVSCVVLLAVSLANIMLCCYPPFEIVLLHLGLFIVAGYVWQHRLLRARNAFFVLVSFVLAALLLLPWFLECYSTLQVVAHTVYPGNRQCVGGGLTPVRLFSGFFGLALTDVNTPAALYNVCEAASFYPLWLLPVGLGILAFIGVLIRAPGSAWDWLSARGLQVMLAAYLFAFTMFALVPVAPWICRMTLLNRTIEVRGLAGIGLAGTLLIVLGLASSPAMRTPWKLALAAGFVWSAGVLAFLLSQQPTLLAPPFNAPFLTTARILGLEGAAIGLGFAYLLAPGRWAMAALAAPFILKTALINPVAIGLPELLDSPALDEVHALALADPAAEWVFYDSLFGVETLKSAGARVVNGVRVIPDPALIHILDPAGRHSDVYNRYSHLIFSQARATEPVSVELEKRVFCVVEISAPEVLALFPRVKFVATTNASTNLESAGFQLLRSWPQDHLWIYRLTGKPHSPQATVQAAPAS